MIFVSAVCPDCCFIVMSIQQLAPLCLDDGLAFVKGGTDTPLVIMHGT